MYNEIFDKPCPPPDIGPPFQPFADAYITGPVPAHLKNETVATLAATLFKVDENKARELVEFGAVWLNDRPCFRPDQPLSDVATFRLNPPAYGPVKFYEADFNRIVYEDADFLVYNKESGRPSQSVPHDAYNNILAACERMLAARGDRPRLWLLHRLDADTSGLLMMAKNKTIAGMMGKAFQEGLVGKEYLCLGLGPQPDQNSFEIKAPIAKEGRRYVVRPNGPGLAAKTYFKVLACEEWRPVTDTAEKWRQVLFQARPMTGRTHQIRLHLAWAGWPIIGDRFYGRPEGNENYPGSRLMLASAGLSFIHPSSKRLITIKLIDIIENI